MSSAHRRSPLLAYVLMCLTSGFYGVWWLHRTMRDLNAMAGRDTFGLRTTVAAGRSIFYACLALSTLMLLLKALLGDAVPHIALIISMSAMLALAIAWTVGLAYIVVRVACTIAKMYDERSLPGKPSPALAGALFFAWFTAVPYLQSKMNRLISANTGHNTGVEADRTA